MAERDNQHQNPGGGPLHSGVDTGRLSEPPVQTSAGSQTNRPRSGPPKKMKQSQQTLSYPCHHIPYQSLRRQPREKHQRAQLHYHRLAHPNACNHTPKRRTQLFHPTRCNPSVPPSSPSF
ncbi:hypothetical protein AMECASPLE_011000 [Ameca splendens]|uniref:Uncharacterized protein n=1 Tax=Ameca splendens TaxID=208324 RepID=A0ABV0XPL7_9TELE